MAQQIKWRASGESYPDEDGDPPYPDVATLKGKAQSIKDLIIALCEDYNPNDGSFTHAAIKPTKEIVKYALEIASEGQTIIDYDVRYGLPR